MARDVLLDTGPLVALLDARDQWHARVMPHWPALVERCVTTEAVLTEASHLAGRGGSPVRVLEFVLAAEIPVAALDVRALRQAAGLMRRYAAVPMDFADATLVVAGDALGVATVFTADRRGFSLYTGGRGLAFHIVPP